MYIKQIAERYKIKKAIGNKLGEKVTNTTGSALMIVMMVGAVLFITTMALLTTVNNTTVVNKDISDGENAYLAAKTGLTMVLDAGSDSSFTKKLVNSCGSSVPIKMDFQDLGNCEVYPTDLGDTLDMAGNTIKRVKLDCIGKYEGSSFKLSRCVNLKKADSSSPPEIKTGAYIGFGDGDIVIDGGIEGNVYIMGDGKLYNTKSSPATPMHEVVSVNALDMTNSACTYDMVASGRRITTSYATIKTDAYVGSKDESGNLYPNIYFYCDGTDIGGVLLSEGDVILSGHVAIGISNYDNTAGTLVNPDLAVVKARGDVYLGYNATHNADGTYAITSKTSAGQEIYGGIICGGDLKIASSVKIFGDIICDGDIEIDGQPRIYGNVYSGGKIVIKGNDVASLFVNSNKIFAKGDIEYSDIEWVKNAVAASGITMYPNQTNIAKLNVFNTISYIGAAEFFDSKVKANPKPVTTFPSKFDSMAPANFTTSDCPGCNDSSYNTHIAHYKESTCWWCNDEPYYNPSTWSHTTHTKPTTETCTGCGDATYNVHIPHTKTVAGVVNVTMDCIIEEDLTLSDSGTSMYIDASANDIDILLRGSITTQKSGSIVINDGGGTHRVRIFMDDGSSLHFKSNWGNSTGILVVSDDAASSNSIAADTLPSSAADSRIDMNKVPQLYFFGREGCTNIKFDLGVNGYVPGYVIMPYVDFKETSNAHCYQDGTDLNSIGNYPYFYGMLICNSLDFQGGTATFIKYDWRLDLLPDGSKTETRSKFDKALGDDNVITYPDAEGDEGGGGGGSGGDSWEVEDMF